MRVFQSITAALVAITLLAPVSWASEPEKSDVSLGKQLVRQIFEACRTRDIAMLEKFLAKGFQNVRETGADNLQEEIEVLKGLNLSNYKLSDFKVTRNGPVIVVTYFASAEETIGGKRLSKTPAPRLSVFLKTDQGWKWLAHANLKPLK